MISVVTSKKVDFKINDEVYQGDDPMFGIVEKKVK